MIRLLICLGVVLFSANAYASAPAKGAKVNLEGLSAEQQTKFKALSATDKQAVQQYLQYEKSVPQAVKDEIEANRKEQQAVREKLSPQARAYLKERALKRRNLSKEARQTIYDQRPRAAKPARGEDASDKLPTALPGAGAKTKP